MYVLVFGIETCIAVEGHANRVVQESRSRATAFAATRRSTRRGALRCLQEDVVRPVLFVGLRLHIKTIASHSFAVQRTGFRHRAQT